MRTFTLVAVAELEPDAESFISAAPYAAWQALSDLHAKQLAASALATVTASRETYWKLVTGLSPEQFAEVVAALTSPTRPETPTPYPLASLSAFAASIAL